MSVSVKDILWKGIIEDLFSDFLRFFYPDADELFDMDKGVEFLDKELGELYPGVDIRHPKFVDKLVKVFKKDGAEKWILIHIEVQGYEDKTFTRRMFTYFSRILDRFDKEVASIAIFTDKKANYCPDVYEYHSLDTSNVFRFKTYKIMGQDKAVLENSDNPFAIVVLTVLIALEKSKGRPEEVFNLSVDLARRLFGKGFSKLKISRLLHFLTSYVYFGDQEICRKFEREISTFSNKDKPMGITELATKLIEEHGIEIGMKKGMEKERATVAAIVTNLLLKSNHSLQEIAELANVSIDFIIDVKNQLFVAENN